MKEPRQGKQKGAASSEATPRRSRPVQCLSHSVESASRTALALDTRASLLHAVDTPAMDTAMEARSSLDLASRLRRSAPAPDLTDVPMSLTKSIIAEWITLAYHRWRPEGCRPRSGRHHRVDGFPVRRGGRMVPLPCAGTRPEGRYRWRVARFVVDITPLRKYRHFRRLWAGQVVSGMGIAAHPGGGVVPGLRPDPFDADRRPHRPGPTRAAAGRGPLGRHPGRRHGPAQGPRPDPGGHGHGRGRPGGQRLALPPGGVAAVRLHRGRSRVPGDRLAGAAGRPAHAGGRGRT